MRQPTIRSMPTDPDDAAAWWPRGIVFEGTDCAGKTRLIKHVKARLAGQGWDVLQMGHRAGDQFQRYFKVYSNASRLLLDRSHVSEVVYGDLALRPGRLSAAERTVLGDILRRDFVTVLCTAPPEVLWYRYLARGYAQPATSFEDMAKAHHAFLAALGSTADVVFESHPVDLTCMTEVNQFFDEAARVVLASLDAGRGKPAA